MLYPAPYEAANDPELTTAERAVMFYLCGQLDLVEFRPVKGWVVARAIHVRRKTVVGSLRRLAELGYIQAGPRLERGIYTYRLVAKRPSTHCSPAA